ncbi:MAG: NYN domain-containing protein [Chloroflexi bacterium]|nr:NYN domain-containing protein [Chloroflexota bacterium]
MIVGTGQPNPLSTRGGGQDARVAIFIDGSNLYHALRDNFGRVDLNFAEFVNKICGQRRLFRTYYYNVLRDPNQRPEGHAEQQQFLDVLRKTPYLEVRLGSTKLSQGVPVEKGIDIMLATDLLHFAWSDLYDVAVLVSGDGDFAYALQSVKNMGKHVEVAYFESNVSRDLLDAADNLHLLDRTFVKGLWRGKAPGVRRSRPPQRRGPQMAPRQETALAPPTTFPPPGVMPPSVMPPQSQYPDGLAVPVRRDAHRAQPSNSVRSVVGADS